jgi:cyclic pyranopterin phosphate synthase
VTLARLDSPRVRVRTARPGGFNLDRFAADAAGLGSERLIDRFGRRVTDLRISVTDRCNFRCTYCLPPDASDWLDRSELLSFEEITAIASLLVRHFGVRSIRLTGGEPTVRADLVRLVEMLAELTVANGDGTGDKVDLSMTTNGVRLAGLADELKRAGLARVNISLDTLKPERFRHITGRDDLPRVLAGIRSARSAGLDPLKLNVVPMRGVNDDELVALAEFGRAEGLEVRFIEVMPLDAGHGWRVDQIVPAQEIVALLGAHYEIEPVRRGSAPASLYRYRDAGGHFGVIASVTQPFCGSCDRIRLTADGKIRNCLFATFETDLREALRNRGDPSEIAELLRQSVLGKWAGHRINQSDFAQPDRPMNRIGG